MRRHAGIRDGAVGFGDLVIDYRLTDGLIFGDDELRSRIISAGFQTMALAGFGIHAIELVALAATDEAETIFHRHIRQPIKEVNRVVTV